MTHMPLADQLVVTRETRPILRRHGASGIRLDLDECLTKACGHATCPCGSAPSLLELCRGRLSVLEIAAVLAQCSSKPTGQILADIVPELQYLVDNGQMRAAASDPIKIDHEDVRLF